MISTTLMAIGKTSTNSTMAVPPSSAASPLVRARLPALPARASTMVNTTRAASDPPAIQADLMNSGLRMAAPRKSCPRAATAKAQARPPDHQGRSQPRDQPI